MKTKIIKLLALMLTMFLAKDVFAYQTYEGSFYEAEKIKGIYFYKNSSATEEKNNQATIYRTTNGKIAYSIEDQEQIKGEEIPDYINTKESHPVYLSTEQAKRIEALAYFGYGYQDDDYDHTQPKWYAVTQYLIWKTCLPNIEYNFVSSAISKTPIYPYNKEITELNNILEEKLKKPNFENYESIKNLTLEEPVTLIDSNNVLKNYYALLSSDKISLKKPTSNQIILTAHKEDTYSLYLYRGFMKYGNNYTYYQSEKYSDMLEQGNLDPKSVALIFYGHAKVEESNTENESSKSDNESKEEIESATEPDSKEEETPEDDEDKAPEGDSNEEEIKQDEEVSREDTNLNDEIESSPEPESKEDENPGDDSNNEENKKDDEELKDDNNSQEEIESDSEPDSKEEKNPEDESSKSDEANKTPEDDSSEDKNQKDDNEPKEDDHLSNTGGETEKDIPNIKDENTSVSKGENESKEEESEENNEENEEDNLENKNETEKEETGKDSLEEDVNSKEETDETNDKPNKEENVDKTEIPNETEVPKKDLDNMDESKNDEESKDNLNVPDDISNSSKEPDSLKPDEEENKNEDETIENENSNNNEIFEDDSKEEISNAENESEGYQDKESEYSRVPDKKDEVISLPEKEELLNPSKDEEKETINIPQIEINVPSLAEDHQQQIENKTHLDMLESNINESDYEQVEVEVPATDAFVLSIIFYLLSIVGLIFVKYAK